MKTSDAEILREYGPYPGNEQVNGVTFDGQLVWWASNDRLNALDPATGGIVRFIEVPAHAGTAFDGRHLFQISRGLIRRIDPASGEVIASIPAPNDDDCSGLAWAEGSLWVGQAEGRRILQLDPDTGEVRRTIVSNRVVTGVTWVDGDLWHGTWEDNGESDLRRVNPDTGEVLECVALPEGTGVSGLESDGGDRFFCGGGRSGKLRVVRRPTRRNQG